MEKLADALDVAGYEVCNLDYPSRHHTVEVLAETHVLPAIASCFDGPRESIAFVTHSMGGILVRQLAATPGRHFDIGRVVMLAPPNGGSEVVDKFGGWRLFEAINGPAGGQLGTAADQLPATLGPAGFELGIVAGNRSINLLLSAVIPGPDDGKVAIERSKLAGMQDFLLVEVSHPFIMKDEQVISQVISFLKLGAFQREPDQVK